MAATLASKRKSPKIGKCIACPARSVTVVNQLCETCRKALDQHYKLTQEGMPPRQPKPVYRTTLRV